jgi:hypothetical protein
MASNPKRHQVDQRKHGLIRGLNDLVRDPATDKVSQGMVWMNVGKGCCVYLLLYHTKELIDHWDTLTILLTFLILPHIATRIIEAKYGVASANK